LFKLYTRISPLTNSNEPAAMIWTTMLVLRQRA